MNFDPVQIKALTFDVFGTVVDWRSSIIADLTAFGAKRGIEADWAGLTDDWRAAYRPMLIDVVAVRRPWAKLDLLNLSALEKLLEKYGLKTLSVEDKEHINNVWQRLSPWPDVIPGLARMKRKFVLATLSNGNMALLTHLSKRADLPWDCILSAELFRHYKRDPEVYNGACDLLGLDRKQVMMVAAHKDDLDAARRQGMKTAYVARPTEYGPRPAPHPKVGHDADVDAADFVDLAEKLGA